MDTVVAPDYQAEVRRDLPRAFLLDVQEYFVVAAKQAKEAITGSHRVVEGGIPLGVRRTNRAAGLIRFQVTDEAFEQLIARHGGDFVGQVKVDGADGPKDAAVHLTTARFGSTLVGFASHHQADDLPVRNASRKALCAQNAGLGPDIFRPREMYVDRERFALIMVRRDQFDIGTIASMTVAITDPRITQFLMQVDLNDFLASYGSQPKTDSGIKLKRAVGRFREGSGSDAEVLKS